LDEKNPGIAESEGLITEQEKDYQRIHYEKWKEKSKNCPEKLTMFRCKTATGICSYEVCPYAYWGCI